MPFSNDVKLVQIQDNPRMPELAISRTRPVQIGLILLLSLVSGCRKQDAPAKPQPQVQAAPAQPQPQVQAAQHEVTVQQPDKDPRKGDFVTVFSGPAMTPARRDPNIDYMLNPNVEQFFVHVPEEYRSETAYGLIVFVDADSDSRGLPNGWRTILDTRKLLYIAPQRAGNDQYIPRRLGLAVLGALEMMKHYRIDPNRVYVAGYSGGARMAGLLGFFQGDLFRGTIQNCGADFYKPVRIVAASSTVDTAGNPYGLFQASAEEIASARQVRFALITGSLDFRHGNILDLYNGGFAEEGFKAKLFDVPGMEHDVADERTLSAVLDFVEGLE